MNLFCFIGLHSWLEWSEHVTLFADPRNKECRLCKRCGAHQEARLINPMTGDPLWVTPGQSVARARALSIAWAELWLAFFAVMLILLMYTFYAMISIKLLNWYLFVAVVVALFTSMYQTMYGVLKLAPYSKLTNLFRRRT